MLIRSDMSGMRCLSGLRASVETFPVWWAFPTAEYSARYDSPYTYGGLSLSQYSSASLVAQERLGPPKFFDASLPACHGLRTPADLPILAHTDGLVLPSVCVKTLGVRNKRLSKLYQHFRGRGSPCGLQDALSTLRPSCSQLLNHCSAMDARLDTGGWLVLTRPGLSPGKRRQAYLAR